MNRYSPAEAARRRRCSLHRGSLGPYCYRCSERERALAQATDDSPCLCGAYDCDATTCVVKGG